MTAAAFVDALTAMRGLLPGMIEHLKSMAPKLTGAERDKAISALKPLDEDLVRLEREHDEILEKGGKEMADIKRKHLPVIKRLAEKADLQSAETVLNSQLTTL